MILARTITPPFTVISHTLPGDFWEFHRPHKAEREESIFGMPQFNAFLMGGRELKRFFATLSDLNNKVASLTLSCQALIGVH